MRQLLVLAQSQAGNHDAMTGNSAGKARGEAGRLTVLACPLCDGAVYEYADGDRLSFRCELGHGFRPDRLCPGAGDDLRQALAGMLRSLALT
jgi:two-component system, chemotaxis family, protein-glutamate methylesterase/glutaminase